MPWAFDPPCSMEPVPAIPAGDWFSDTSVPGPPDPVEACLDALLPPIADPPACPTLARTVRSAVATVPAGSEYLTMSVSETDDCTFAFALAAGFPVECPTFPAAATDAAVRFVPQGAQYVRLRAESASPPPGGACAFDFAADVGFPCVNPPDVRHVAAAFGAPGSERVGLAFRTADVSACSYSADVELTVPRPGGFLGRVLSGLGRSWNVRLYPNGPSDEGTAFDTSIDVPGAEPAFLPDPGAWIAPVLPFAPWGAAPHGADLVYALSSLFGLEIGFTGPAGIPARSGTVPQYADDVQLVDLTLSGDTSQAPGATVRVYNIFGADVGGLRYVVMGRIAGHRFVIAEDCNG